MKRLVIVFLLFLVACASGQDQKPFDIVAEYFEAKVTYTTGFSNKVGKKNVKYIDLNIMGGPYVNTEPPKQLSAYAAVLLYTNLSDEDRAKYTHIQINLFRNEAQKETDRTYNYDINTIHNLATLSANFQKVEEMLLNNTPDDIYNLFVEKNKPPDLNRFVPYFKEKSIERSGVKSVKLLGVTSLIDDGAKERYIGFNGQVEWGNADTTIVMIETYRDPTIKGITYIDVQ